MWPILPTSSAPGGHDGAGPADATTGREAAERVHAEPGKARADMLPRHRPNGEQATPSCFEIPTSLRVRCLKAFPKIDVIRGRGGLGVSRRDASRRATLAGGTTSPPNRPPETPLHNDVRSSVQFQKMRNLGSALKAKRAIKREIIRFALSFRRCRFPTPCRAALLRAAEAKHHIALRPPTPRTQRNTDHIKQGASQTEEKADLV